MSTCIRNEISCPHCGAVNKKQMWVGVDGVSDPRLRTLILDETFFDWQCPDCGYRASMVYPCLYHDKKGKWMVCLAPNGRVDELRRLDKQHAALSAVKKRLVETPAALKEKLLIFERGLDDVALEMIKLALRELVEKKRDCRVERSFFLTREDSLDYIGFAFFLEGIEKPIYQGVRPEVYEKALVTAQRSDFVDQGFQQVDAALAKTLLEQQ